ncbi:hypothetical protein GMORB2_6618 [Geosmithia morbida]|uniref:DUF6594 domain-containing protein n=1 Tax=Geosmithia morbida TaxID=1094350 RepID=A0A9P4YW28_9HYPO|nr:uncharacterized protein GMORB2_6618 [Geosmithia morbida]KAF4123070.1 hypothetical protein GMORB2_6618 [Geosmithia morbida]
MASNFPSSIGPRTYGLFLIRTVQAALAPDERWLAFQNVADRCRVKNWDVESVKHWHAGSNSAAIEPSEKRYVDEVDDLVYVLPPLRLPPLLRLFAKFFKSSDGEDEKTVVLNKERARRVFGLISFPFALSMLIGPLWILNVLPNINARLGGITGFVLLLALHLVLSTPAKAEVIWGTTAACSAVLMVLLQIQSSTR